MRASFALATLLAIALSAGTDAQRPSVEPGPLDPPGRPERGCASVAVYFLGKLLDREIAYGACRNALGASPAGASLAEMERATAELGFPLRARSVSAAELRTAREPLILLTAPRYAVRDGPGDPRPVGHYVVAVPVGSGQWQLLDYPTDRPRLVDVDALARALDLPPGAAVIALGTSPVAGGGAVDFAGPYTPSWRVRTRAGGAGPELLDLGETDAPSPGAMVEVPVDVTGHWVGEPADVVFRVRNASAAPIRLEAGESSCGCAKLQPAAGEVAPGDSGVVLGRVMVGGTLAVRAEHAEVLVVGAAGGPPARIRVRVAGAPKLRVVMEPPVVSFGPVVPGDSVPARRIRVSAADGGVLALGAERAGPFGVSVVRAGPDGELELDVRLEPGAGMLGDVRAAVPIVRPGSGATVAEVPVQATFVPRVRAEPPVAVLGDGAGAVVRFVDATGRGVSIEGSLGDAVELVGAVGVVAEVGKVGEVGAEMRLRVVPGSRPPRVQRVRVRAVEVEVTVVVRGGDAECFRKR